MKNYVQINILVYLVKVEHEVFGRVLFSITAIAPMGGVKHWSDKQKKEKLLEIKRDYV